MEVLLGGQKTCVKITTWPQAHCRQSPLCSLGLSFTGCKTEEQTRHCVPEVFIGNSVKRGTIKLGK